MKYLTSTLTSLVFPGIQIKMHLWRIQASKDTAGLFSSALRAEVTWGLMYERVRFILTSGVRTKSDYAQKYLDL